MENLIALSIFITLAIKGNRLAIVAYAVTLSYMALSLTLFGSINGDTETVSGNTQAVHAIITNSIFAVGAVAAVFHGKFGIALAVLYAIQCVVIVATMLDILYLYDISDFIFANMWVLEIITVIAHGRGKDLHINN